MKDLIKKQLKTKYSNLGFSDKSFESVAEYLSNTVKEESEIETATGGVENLLKAFQGETDKLRTDKSAADKKSAELEAKIKTLSGSGGAGNPEPPKTDETPEWAKALVSRLDNLESEKVTKSRQDKLNSLLDGVPDVSKKAYTRYKVDSYSEEEFETLMSEITPEIEEIKTQESTKGSGYFPPKSGGGGGAKGKPSDAEVAEVATHLNI